jgi:methoxymalonate biosynthesis protein
VTLETARARIHQQLRHAELMGALPADREQGELTRTVALPEVAEATAVIEAVTESADIKA